VVGVSSDKRKFGYKVWVDFQRKDFQVYAVNPKINQINGKPVYASLSDLPKTPDWVVLVVPPERGRAVLEDAARLGIPKVWFQPGAESDELLALARKLGLKTVQNVCIMWG
jgi:hypothetical protein